MPEILTRFHYTARDPQGHLREGELDAPHADGLVGEFDKLGWKVQSFRALTTEDSESSTSVWIDDSAGAVTLSAAESAELSGHMAELVFAGMPLESGLAAIAEELPSRRLKRAMRGIVARLERGENLDLALKHAGAPPYLQAVVRAGSRSGTLGDALERYAGTSEALRGTVPIVIGSLGYAAVAFLLWLATFGFLVWIVLPSFSDLFEGFGVTLPWLTVATLSAGKYLREYGHFVLLAIAGLIAIIYLGFRAALGSVGFRRVVHSIPGVGTVVRSLALCRFSVLLSLLVHGRVPLSESLRLAGDATSDPAVAADARELANLIQDGSSPESVDRRPHGFVRALYAPYGPDGLIDGMQGMSEVYAARVRYALVFLATIIPPSLIITLGVGTAIIIVAMYMPLIDLLKSLA
ncbi:MAG: type II secretion system F family protein [Planctomycetota bacterium]|nr:type II secretion system F family protein [Planctomycetota bacterium]